MQTFGFGFLCWYAAALPAHSNGYIRVDCYGGLNQMRRDVSTWPLFLIPFQLHTSAPLCFLHLFSFVVWYRNIMFDVLCAICSFAMALGLLDCLMQLLFCPNLKWPHIGMNQGKWSSYVILIGLSTHGVASLLYINFYFPRMPVKATLNLSQL